MPGKLSGQRAMITGASSGIGLALAEQLLKQGASLVLVARNAERLEAARTKLIKQHAQASIEILALDIRDGKAVQQLRQHSLDILVNNAGIVSCDLHDSLLSQTYRDMLETNFFAQVSVTQALLPGMLSRGQGYILNVSSMAADMGLSGYSAYGASKAALANFTDCLRNELANSPVGVGLALPADVDTPQYHEEEATKPEANKAISGQVTPMSPEQAARQLLKMIVKRQRGQRCIGPLSARVGLWLYRCFPNLGRRLLDRIAARHLPNRR